MPSSASPSLVLGHRQEVVAGHRPDQVGMVVFDVLLGLGQQRLLVVGADHLAALAVDRLRHLIPSLRRYAIETDCGEPILTLPWANLGAGSHQDSALRPSDDRARRAAA